MLRNASIANTGFNNTFKFQPSLRTHTSRRTQPNTAHNHLLSCAVLRRVHVRDIILNTSYACLNLYECVFNLAHVSLHNCFVTSALMLCDLLVMNNPLYTHMATKWKQRVMICDVLFVWPMTHQQAALYRWIPHCMTS
jgi:hypothetical protein